MRITLGQLRGIIREELSRQFLTTYVSEARVSAGSEYVAQFENPMSAVQSMLRDYLMTLPREKVVSMAPGSAEVMQEVERALDEIGVEDPAKRELIRRPLKMIPPAAFLASVPGR